MLVMTPYPLLGLVFVAACDLFGSRILPFLPVSRIMCGLDTTVVSSPVRGDGTIDYAAAYNLRASNGVTPENNAAVLIERAFGPERVPENSRSKYYRNLGIDELPLSGDYFHFSDEAISQLLEVPDTYGGEHNHLGVAAQRKWSRQEFLDVAAALDANRIPLERLEQASRKPKYFFPLVTKYWIADFDNLVWLAHTRLNIATRLIRARAMLKLSEGDADGAVGDLLICQRLMRLLGQSSISISSAGTISEIGRCLSLNLEAVLAEPLTAQQLVQFQTAFRATPIAIDTFASLDLYSRFATLDLIQETWIRMYSFEMYMGATRRSWIDINAAMRRCNKYFDAAIQAQKLGGAPKEQQAIQALEDDLKGRSDTALQQLSEYHASPLLVLESRQVLSEAFAVWTMRSTSESSIDIGTTNHIARTRDELGNIAFALARYRTTYGKYPDRLEALVPQFLKQVLHDRFADRPLTYHIQPQGYLLYSIGNDLKDDDGRAPDSRDWESGDLSFRITHPETAAEKAARYRERERIKQPQMSFSPGQQRLGIAVLILILGWATWRFIVGRMPRL
jgi:hypothetical protein